MKTLVLGDTHGRDTWLRILEKEAPDLTIFIGDYVDTHDNISGLAQLDNLRTIIACKEKFPGKVILLIGNHDYHYWPGIYENYSGYQSQMRASFEYEFKTYSHLFQAVYEQDGILFAHAGVTEQWLKNKGLTKDDPHYLLVDQINELFKHKPQEFRFDGFNPYGDNITQGPFWVRPGSLIKDHVEGYKQVVGHTTMNIIDPKHYNDERDLFWFIDTLGTSGEYLIIEDGNITIQK